MDTTQDINTVEWFFGYGGNHLGLKRVLPNLRLLAACEIEEFAVENILAKMEAGLLEAAPIWSDCKTFPWEPFVDRTHLFVASYLCQPFSAAGKRQGTEDERHLWPYVYRWILRARPLLVFLENVEGHVSLGLSTVISDLEEGGYKATWGIFSASEVGAPHQRKRVFILAYRHGERGQLPDWWRVAAKQVPFGYGETWRDGRELVNAGISSANSQPSQCRSWDVSRQGATGESSHPWPSRPGEQQFAWEPPRVVGKSDELRPQGRHDTGGLQAMGISRAELAGANGKYFSRQTQPPLGRNPDGPADWLDYAELYTTRDNRTDELRLLGNGVVPATAERAFRVLIGELADSQHEHDCGL